MKSIDKIVLSTLLGLLLLSFNSCEKIDSIENPNAMTSQEFWSSDVDALKATTAIYAALGRWGTYRRWLLYVTEISSDLGRADSPWTDLSNVSKFTYRDYNFMVNREVWHDHYRGIYRANQVLTNVPAIDMDESFKTRLLAEAHFLRAFFYYNLVNLYGNVPLADGLADGEEQLKGYPQQGIPALYELIENDLTEAKKHLPTEYEDSGDLGRATWGAATALLGKTYMQQHKYGLAESEFQEVINSGLYELVPEFRDNFILETENNEESIFEIQFSDQFNKGSTSREGGQDGSASGSLGSGMPRQVSPFGTNDAQANDYYVDSFFIKYNDPRLVDTYIYENDTELYYGMLFSKIWPVGSRKGRWFRKYLRDYYNTKLEGEDYESPINHRAIRLGDVKLLYAEALLRNGKETEALAQVQEIRDRVGAGVSPFIDEGYSTAKVIEFERILELSGELHRWFDLRRLGYFDNEAGENSIETLKSVDPEFEQYNFSTKGYLPIPTPEVDLNPEVDQNDGW